MRLPGRHKHDTPHGASLSVSDSPATGTSVSAAAVGVERVGSLVRAYGATRLS